MRWCLSLKDGTGGHCSLQATAKSQPRGTRVWSDIEVCRGCLKERQSWGPPDSNMRCWCSGSLISGCLTPSGHRLTEQFGLEDHVGSNPPCYGKRHLPLGQIVIQPGLEHFQGVDVVSRASLGNLSVPSHPHSKEFPLNIEFKPSLCKPCLPTAWAETPPHPEMLQS